MSCKTGPKADPPVSTEKRQNSAIDSLGNRYLDLGRFSGAILVSKKDSIIYSNSFGLADYADNREFSETTAFKIGELSELITAEMVRKMAMEGKIRLSDKLSQHIPEIQADFTINDLLNHNTNLPDIRTIKDQNPEVQYTTLGYTRLALDSLGTPKKSELEYNLLGLLIEQVTGLSYSENLQNYSADLGLQNTYFQGPDSSLAVGYLYHNYRGNGLELQESPVSNPNITFSSAGIKSTAKDLLGVILSAPDKPVDTDGFMEDDGFSYSVFNDPQTRTAIVVLSNRRHPVAGEIANTIKAILKGKEYTLPLLRKPFNINTESLQNYSGFYALNENMNLEVLNENDSLFVLMGPNKVHLIPQSENQFYIEQRDASLRFYTDSTNTVNAVELLDGFLEGNKIMRTK